MSVPAITPAAASQINAKEEIVRRRTAKFQPSVWTDRLANYEGEDINMTDAMKNQVEELKVVVRSEVFTAAAANGSRHQLKLIDAIQRLGVAYHFRTEIEQALEREHATYLEVHDDDDDLYSVALRFRLLRQHGYHVSCDVFNKFKDANDGFKENLAADICGFLSFYEAAHLRVHGEHILEEAIGFTTTHLKSATTLDGASSLLKAQITEALERPILKTLERLGAPRYMSIYQDEVTHNEDLLKFAKLDFNLVQCSHKKELSEMIRWYKEVDFEKKLPFVRARIVELFFWIVGVYFEPQYEFGRKILTKLIVVVTAMDDIYDAYGTFEELAVLTEAIERWDASCLDDQPDYLKSFCKEYLAVLDEIEDEMIKQGRSYRVSYAKEAMKNQARLYFAEAKWLHEACIPSMDDYLRVAAVSIGNTILFVISLLCIGDVVTKEAFEWVVQYPKILRASNVMFRLMDDIAGDKFEKERGHVASSIDCYMKQYGVSEQETLDVFNKQIVDFWKDINEEVSRPTAVPRPVLDRVLNLTRVADILYKRGDAFTHGGKLMTYIITTLFIDPVPL